VTDRDGDYVVEGLAWGFYRIEVSGGDFCCTGIASFFLPSETAQILDLGLPLRLTHGLEANTIRGRIRGEDGGPIADASVTLTSAHEPSRWDQTRANASGEYQFVKRQPGEYVVHASKPGFLAASTAVDLGGGTNQTVNIELKAGNPKGVGAENRGHS
jgi:hypothetical protein